jgi:two-component system LytT family response regulator
MPGFRVLTVDDKAIARNRLRCLISRDPECELIGECASGAEAIRSLDRVQPDILFVDAQMPEMDGFEVARAIAGRPPLVILTSECSTYAVRAFEEKVFDFLLKPLEETRFNDSLDRAKAEIAHGRITTLRPPQLPERIAVRQNGRVLFLRVDEIDWIEAADNYVCLHCAGKTHMLRETMSQAEARLDPARFTRIHRSAIVNIDRIRELHPWFRGDYQVILEDGTKLILTKKHRERLDSQLLLGSFTG